LPPTADLREDAEALPATRLLLSFDLSNGRTFVLAECVLLGPAEDPDAAATDVPIPRTARQLIRRTSLFRAI